MRSLNGLAWRNLAARRLRTFLTGSAIALGAAAVFATSLIAQSAQARTDSLAKQMNRADLEITPRDADMLDARWLDVARAQPDVALASPEIVHVTLLLQPPGASLILLGIEPDTYAALEQVEMANGRALILNKPWMVIPERWAQEYHVSAGGELVMPAEHGSPTQWLVSGLIRRRDDAGAVTRDRTALVPLPALQAALGLRRKLTRIRLALRPGRDARQAEAALSQVLAAHPLAQDSPVIVSKVEAGGNTGVLYGIITGGLALTGAVILLAAALLIVNTFAMNITDRTREIGILRSLGMGRSDVLRGVLVEAGLLGAVGSLVGLPLGWALAEGIVRLLIVWQRLEWEHLSLSTGGLIAAPLIGMSVALAAALWPARQASLVPPLAAIHSYRQDQPARTSRYGIAASEVVACGLAAAVLVTEVWLALDPTSRRLDFGSMSMLCLLMTLLTLIAGVLLLPRLSGGLAMLLRGLLLQSRTMIGRLVGDQLIRHRQRTALTAGTLAVGVAMVILLTGTVGALTRIAEGMVFGLMRDDFGLMAFSMDESFEASNPLAVQRQKEWPRRILTTLDALRDRAFIYGLGFSEPVEDLETTPGAGLLVLDDVEAFLRAGSFRYEQGDLESAARILRRGRGILITPSVARRYHVTVGDELMVRTRRGRVPFHVAAVGASPWWGVIISHADAETFLGASVPIGYFVTARPGVDKASIEARLREGIVSFPEYKLFEIGPGSNAVQVSIGRIFNALTALLNGLTVLALVIGSLGQINTMMASVLERKRELGVLRSVGLTRRQVHLLVLVEAAAVGVMGALAGTLIGTVPVLAYLFMFYTSTVEAAGFGAPTWASVSSGIGGVMSSVRWVVVFGLAFAPLMTMAAAWLPAHRAANVSIIEAIQD